MKFQKNRRDAGQHHQHPKQHHHPRPQQVQQQRFASSSVSKPAAPPKKFDVDGALSRPGAGSAAAAAARRTILFAPPGRVYIPRLLFTPALTLSVFAVIQLIFRRYRPAVREATSIDLNTAKSMYALPCLSQQPRSYIHGAGSPTFAMASALLWKIWLKEEEVLSDKGKVTHHSSHVTRNLSHVSSSGKTLLVLGQAAAKITMMMCLNSRFAPTPCTPPSPALDGSSMQSSRACASFSSPFFSSLTDNTFHTSAVVVANIPRQICHVNPDP